MSGLGSADELTSVRAAPVAAARRLAKRALRAQHRRFLAEGPQAVREALAAPGVVETLFVTTEAVQRHGELLRAAAGVPVQRVSGAVMEAIAQTVTPQGVIAVCRFVDVDLQRALQDRPTLVTVLAQARDPGNAGTVIRVADAAGADAVILSSGSVDVYNAKCARATVGSLFHLPITVAVEISAAADELRARGLQILAADGTGADDVDALAEAGALARPTAWLFGNEAWGLPPEVRSVADRVVRVPIHGRAESLNLASAAAVCLYATAREQRRRP